MHHHDEGDPINGIIMTYFTCETLDPTFTVTRDALRPGGRRSVSTMPGMRTHTTGTCRRYRGGGARFGVVEWIRGENDLDHYGDDVGR